MSDWKETTLGNIADITKLAGFEYTKYFEYIEDGEIIALRALNIRNGSFDLSNIKTISKEVSDLLPRSKLFKDDILFTYVGANIGQFALVGMNDKYHLAPNICRIRADNNSLYPYFLYSYFRSSIFKDDLENFSVGSSQPTMPMGNVRKIPILLPPLPEQKAIAAVLSSLDDKIDLLHRQNKTLESIAETLFRQWFIEEAQDDWEKKTLSYFGNIICGKTPSKKKTEYFNGTVPFIKIPDMHGNTYIIDTIDTLTEEGRTSQTNKMIPPFSVCVSCIATVGLVSMNVIESQTNQQINTIVPSKEIYRYYLFLYMKNSFDLLQAMGSGGTATLNINTSSFSKMDIEKPDDVILENFSNEVSPYFEKIVLNNTQIKTLERMRDSLLPKLMSGDVRVEYEVEA